MAQSTVAASTSQVVSQSREKVAELLLALDAKDAEKVRAIFPSDWSPEDLAVAFGEAVRFLFEYVRTVAYDLDMNLCTVDVAYRGEVRDVSAAIRSMAPEAEGTILDFADDRAVRAGIRLVK